MKWSVLGVLGLKIVILGALAFGGLTVVLAELQDFFVGPGLLTADQFTQAYALASAAPGPNGPIFMSLLGWETFGAHGVVVLVIAWAVPTLFITHQLGRLSQADGHAGIARLLGVLKAGAVGLILAGVLSLAKSFDTTIPMDAAIQITLAAIGTVLLIRTKVNPLLVLAGCMAVGAVLI